MKINKLFLSALLIMQAIICSENKTQNNSLFSACDGKFGSMTRAFVALLDKKTEVNARNADGMTVLHYAADNNNCKLFEFLMMMRKKDIDVNARSTHFPHDTALHMVASEDNPKRAKMLLQAGAEVDPVNHYNETPLHIAVLKSAVLVQVLIDYNANPVAESYCAQPPLHRLCYFAGSLKNDYDMIQKAKILLGTGLDINRLTDCSSMTSKTSALYQLRCASNSNSYSNFPLMKALEEFLLSQGAQSIKEEKCFGK